MLRASLAACALLASAPSCPDLYSLATHGFTVPTLQEQGAVSAPQPGGLLVSVTFQAQNPNPYPISIASVDYQVSLEGQPVFAGTRDAIDVPENGGDSINLEGLVDTGQPVFHQLQPGQSAAYSLTGTAHVKTPAGIPVDVDFDSAGTFVVPSGLPAAR